MGTSSLRITALFLDITGALLLATSLLVFHARLEKEGSIDRSVIAGLHVEAIIAYIAIAFLVASFVLLIIDELNQS